MSTKPNAALELLTTLKSEVKAFRGGEVTVRELTYAQVTEFSKMASEMESVDEMENNKQALSRIIRAGIVEYSEVNEDTIGSAPPAALKELGEMVMDFNGLGAVDVPNEKG